MLKGIEMIRSVSRLLSLDRIQNASGFVANHISTFAFPLQFQVSPALWGEPLKKKKKIDPAILRIREERRKKRIMREIKKLMKLDKQLKPIAEFDTPLCLINELEKRKRNVKISDSVAEDRVLLLKEWSRKKLKDERAMLHTLWRLTQAQKEALDELRLESEELYQAAVKIDPNLIPFKFTGPTETPMKEDYPIPDGAYIDVSRKWV